MAGADAEIISWDADQNESAIPELADRLKFLAGRSGDGLCLLRDGVWTREALFSLAESLKGGNLALGLDCRADSFVGRTDWRAPAAAGVKLITWHGCGVVALKPLAALLRSAAKAGIWNRLILPGRTAGEAPEPLERFVAANPNLAHSWLRPHGAGQAPSVYKRVPSLAGRPWWQTLSDETDLLAALARGNLICLSRQRVRADGSLFRVGEGLDYRFDAPARLADELMELACLMVEEGGAVDPALVRHHLHGAFVIAHCHEEGELIGVSCLKNPRPRYLEQLGARTGLELTGFVERGYTSVRPEYRGLGVGTRLLEGETALAREQGVPLYSILGMENTGAQAMATRNGSKMVAQFHSPKAGKDLGLWLPDWVLENPKLRPKGMSHGG